MRRVLVRWLINAIALYVAVYVMRDAGIEYKDGWTGLFVMAAVIGLVNALIGPVLKILSCPLILLTLGLFTLIINAILLQLAAWFGDAIGVGFYVRDFRAAFWAALIISVVSIFLNLLLGEPRKRRR